MKKLIVIVAVLVSGIVNAQNIDQRYEAIFFSQIDFLNRYDIFYIGSHDRYLVESGYVDSLPAGPNSDISKELRSEYAKFVNWAPYRFKTLPDTNQVLSFETYFSDKVLEDATAFAFGAVSTKHEKIVNFAHIEVNDKKSNVKSIDILEVYIARGKGGFGSIIFFTNFEGVTELLTNK
jgi:hypothetical protein